MADTQRKLLFLSPICLGLFFLCVQGLAESADLGFSSAAQSAAIGGKILDAKIASRDAAIADHQNQIQKNNQAIDAYKARLQTESSKQKAEYVQAIQEKFADNQARQEEINRLSKEKQVFSSERAGVTQTGQMAAKGVAATSSKEEGGEHQASSSGNGKASPMMMPPPPPPPPASPPPPPPSSNSSSDSVSPPPPPPPPPPPAASAQNEQVVDNGELMAAIQKFSQSKDTASPSLPDPSSAAAATADAVAAQVKQSGDEQLALVEKQKAQVAASQIPNPISDSAHSRSLADASSRQTGAGGLGAAMGGSIIGGAGSGGSTPTQRDATSGATLNDKIAALNSGGSTRGRAMTSGGAGPSSSGGGDEKAGEGGTLDLSAMMGGAVAEAEGMVATSGSATTHGASGNSVRTGDRGIINLNAPALPGPLGVVMRENKYVAGSNRPVTAKPIHN